MRHGSCAWRPVGAWRLKPLWTPKRGKPGCTKEARWRCESLASPPAAVVAPQWGLSFLRTDSVSARAALSCECSREHAPASHICESTINFLTSAQYPCPLPADGECADAWAQIFLLHPRTSKNVARYLPKRHHPSYSRSGALIDLPLKLSQGLQGRMNAQSASERGLPAGLDCCMLRATHWLGRQLGPCEGPGPSRFHHQPKRQGDLRLATWRPGAKRFKASLAMHAAG